MEQQPGRYSVALRGGQVFTAGALRSVDVYVQGEHIAVLTDGEDRLEAHKEIDANGKWILPGVVDLHAHTREPGYTHKEDYATASSAAAVGGVTTFVDMPNVEPPTTSVALLVEKRELASEKCVIDYGHFASGVDLSEVSALAENGICGYKIFQVKGAYPHDPRLALNDTGDLLRAFEAIAETGLLCVVHPCDQSVFELLVEQALADGEPPNHVTFGKVYTDEVIWCSAVAVLLQLQRRSQVRLHLVHTHSAGCLRMIRAAKADGHTVTAEVDPKYYHLSADDLALKGPKACPGGFIFHDEERMSEIWRSIADGTLDHIGSDHAPHTAAELDRMLENAFDAAMGSPQYDHYLSVLLTDVAKGRMSLESLVRVMSQRPAELLGIYPKKGAILPGSDADLVMIDPDVAFDLTDDLVKTKVGWSPYSGWTVRGRPVLTMVRGTVVAEGGEVVGKPGFGQPIAAVPVSAVSVHQ